MLLQDLVGGARFLGFTVHFLTNLSLVWFGWLFSYFSKERVH